MNMTTALAVALLSQNGHAMKASIHLTALELEKLDLWNKGWSSNSRKQTKYKEE